MYKLIISGDHYTSETEYKFETIREAMQVSNHIRDDDRMNKLSDTYFKLINVETNKIISEGY